MKKVLLGPFVLLLFSASILVFQTSCKTTTAAKTTQSSPSTYPIAGLWVGTYIVGDGGPVPAGTHFFFSFSIYADGKLSYKSKGYYNGSRDYITFADGTWSLNGTAFSFSVRTVNIAGDEEQHKQSGTAIYNSSSGTFTKGIISDPLGGSATWTMTRVN